VLTTKDRKNTKLKKLHRRIAVRNSPIHGRGVFALRRIPKGMRIIEYKGTLITDKEADRRFGKLQENSAHTMLFSVDGGMVIDATRRGNSARWINHSCAPNCEIEEQSQRVFIEARRMIRPGEELTYDYNLQIGERHTKKAKRAHACLCGSKRCRGTMLGEEEED
jgi:SET domain-containing protein